MIFKEKMITRMEDFDSNGELTWKAVVQLFENVGSHHSDSVGDSVIDGSFNGQAWILTEWKLEMLTKIPYMKELYVETWSKGALNALLVERDYQLKDIDGNVLAKGVASFVLLNTQKGRPERITEDLVEKYAPESLDVFEGRQFARMKEPKEYQSQQEIVLRRTDIDFNHHVHNLTYLDYVTELLPTELYSQQNFTHCRIAYRKAFEEGEQVIGKCLVEGSTVKIGFYGVDQKVRTMVELTCETK